MNKRLKAFLIIILTNLFFLNFIQSQGIRPNKLYGSIECRNETSIEKMVIISISDFKIELFSAKKEIDKTKENKKALFTTYPDYFGYFGFNGVPEGDYYLKISLGGFSGKEWVEKFSVEKKITVKYKNGKQRLTPLVIVFDESKTAEPTSKRER
jgi:hypothetical protein